jgi:hypothetical protein
MLILAPNTFLILYTHFESKPPSFFTQNYLILNLFGFYINGNLDLLIIGVLNIIVTISLLSADEDTYEHFNLWFDAIGITPFN